MEEWRKFRAPGRVNIIGEHTDYNDGFVLPFSIDMHVQVKLRRSNSHRFIVYSEYFDEHFESDEIKRTGKWVDYIIGVVWAFEEDGYKVDPMEIHVESNLPMGVGLSSSAALEVSVGYGLSKIMNYGIAKMELVRIARKAEVEFVGVKCGVMDQFTAVFGRKDNAIFLDTMKMEFEYIPLNLGEFEFKLIDSKVKHELSFSEYNRRRRECEEILKILGKRSFRELAIDDLKDLKDEKLRKRGTHVLEENRRVLESVEHLKRGEMIELGRLLYESHYSLRDLYEVSCEEVDFIVDFLRECESVAGARMVGGGFGGGIIVLVKKGRFNEIFGRLRESYRRIFGRNLDYLDLKSAGGVEEVEP